MSWDKAATVLKGNGVVAMPTDTVYGLFSLPNSKHAVKKIYRIKGRPKTKPLVLMLSNKNYLKKFLIFNDQYNLLIEKFLPGALTVVGKASSESPELLVQGDTLGIRIPAHDELLELLKTFEKGLASTSANVSGRQELITSDQVRQELGDTVDYIVEGESYGKKPSTVISIAEETPVILRKGAIPILEIERVLGREVILEEHITFNVLIVCTGNTCRSPMAEWVLRKSLPAEFKSHVAVRSAGTLETPGNSMAPLARETLIQIGIQPEQHQSKPVDTELMEWADLILCMEEIHLGHVESRGFGQKAMLFDQLDHEEIPDPIGSGPLMYERVRDRIVHILRGYWIPYLARKWRFNETAKG